MRRGGDAAPRAAAGVDRTERGRRERRPPLLGCRRRRPSRRARIGFAPRAAFERLVRARARPAPRREPHGGDRARLHARVRRDLVVPYMLRARCARSIRRDRRGGAAARARPERRRRPARDASSRKARARSCTPRTRSRAASSTCAPRAGSRALLPLERAGLTLDDRRASSVACSAVAAVGGARARLAARAAVAVRARRGRRRRRGGVGSADASAGERRRPRRARRARVGRMTRPGPVPELPLLLRAAARHDGRGRVLDEHALGGAAAGRRGRGRGGRDDARAARVGAPPRARAAAAAAAASRAARAARGRARARAVGAARDDVNEDVIVGTAGAMGVLPGGQFILGDIVATTRRGLTVHVCRGRTTVTCCAARSAAIDNLRSCAARLVAAARAARRRLREHAAARWPVFLVQELGAGRGRVALVRPRDGRRTPRVRARQSFFYQTVGTVARVRGRAWRRPSASRKSRSSTSFWRMEFDASSAQGARQAMPVKIRLRRRLERDRAVKSPARRSAAASGGEPRLRARTCSDRRFARASLRSDRLLPPCTPPPSSTAGELLRPSVSVGNVVAPTPPPRRRAVVALLPLRRCAGPRHLRPFTTRARRHAAGTGTAPMARSNILHR